jgi:hypothetical protein
MGIPHHSAIITGFASAVILHQTKLGLQLKRVTRALQPDHSVQQLCEGAMCLWLQPKTKEIQRWLLVGVPSIGNMILWLPLLLTCCRNLLLLLQPCRNLAASSTRSGDALVQSGGAAVVVDAARNLPAATARSAALGTLLVLSMDATHRQAISAAGEVPSFWLSSNTTLCSSCNGNSLNEQVAQLRPFFMLAHADHHMGSFSW